MKLDEWEAKYRHISEAIAKKIIKVMPEDGTLIDVGANVGVVTEEVLKHRNCKAYLFEPVPAYYEYCKAKFEDRATVEPFALGDKSETLTLWTDPDNLGWNTFVSEKRTAGMSSLQVQVMPFDEYAKDKDIDRIDAIKIDVEGFEYAVLRGMHETLTKFHPTLFVEIGWGVFHPHWQAEVAEFEWLFENGYQRFDYQFENTMDVVFSPSGENEKHATRVHGRARRTVAKDS